MRIWDHSLNEAFQIRADTTSWYQSPSIIIVPLVGSNLLFKVFWRWWQRKRIINGRGRNQFIFLHNLDWGCYLSMLFHHGLRSSVISTNRHVLNLVNIVFPLQAWQQFNRISYMIFSLSLWSSQHLWILGAGFQP